MLAPLRSHLHRLIGGRGRRFEVFLEVPAIRGVPDIILTQFTDSAASRMQAVTTHGDVATWLAMTDRQIGGAATATAKDLARHVGLSSGHIGSVVLPRLCNLGIVDQVRRGNWRLIQAYETPASRLVTIELKTRDKIGALMQASAHGQGVDFAWVVLDAARLQVNEPAWMDLGRAFSQRGVGVAILRRPRGGLTILSRPSIGGTISFSDFTRRVARALLAERTLGLRLTGSSTGPTWPVFGRDLAAIHNRHDTNSTLTSCYG